MGYQPKCNICGASLTECELQDDLYIHTRLGYGSRHDGDRLDLRLCHACMDTLIDSCVVSPLVHAEDEMTELKLSTPEELAEALQRLGISLYGEDGSIRDTEELLSELGDFWQRISQENAHLSLAVPAPDDAECYGQMSIWEES